MDKILRDIKELKIQGAREVAKAGLKYLRFFVTKHRFKNKKDMVSKLQRESKKLIKLRVTEPALRNTLISILVKVQNAPIEDVEKLKKYILKLSDDKMKEFNIMLETISRFGSEIIADGDTILTHCHSHLVVEIFRRAKKDGKDFTVIVTETRPRNQGLLTLKDLLKSGINIVYCVDSAIGYVMKDVTKVLTGCDAILPDGSIVNKIGTLPMAIVAKRFGKPFYIAGETIKSTEEVEIEERGPEEVLNPKKFPKAKIINPAFDIIPAEYTTEIITEKGRIKPDLLNKLRL
jgi:ribose 1,5-bisphosphate isomerase